MDQHHLHLIVNHLSIFGLFFSVVLLALAIWLKKNAAVRRIALGAVIFTAIGTIPAYLSGEGAEDALSDVANLGVSHDVMHEHEEAGELAFILTSVLGVLAIGALVYTEKSEKAAGAVLGVMLLLSLGVFAYVGYVSNLGGQIHRPLLRGETVMRTAESEHDHDDD